MVDILGEGMSLVGQIASGITGGPNLIEEGKRMTDAGVRDIKEAIMPSVSNIHSANGVAVNTNER